MLIYRQFTSNFKWMIECIHDHQISEQHDLLYETPQYKSAPRQNNNVLSLGRKKETFGVRTDNTTTSGYDWREINGSHHVKCFLSVSTTQQQPPSKKTVCVIAESWCPAVSLSDGLCDWNQAEWRSRNLERSGSLHLPRGGPWGHRGVPAGAFAGGSACTHTCLTSSHNGTATAHTPPPAY